MHKVFYNLIPIFLLIWSISAEDSTLQFSNYITVDFKSPLNFNGYDLTCTNGTCLMLYCAWDANLTIVIFQEKGDGLDISPWRFSYLQNFDFCNVVTFNGSFYIIACNSEEKLCHFADIFSQNKTFDYVNFTASHSIYFEGTHFKNQLKVDNSGNFIFFAGFNEKDNSTIFNWYTTKNWNMDNWTKIDFTPECDDASYSFDTDGQLWIISCYYWDRWYTSLDLATWNTVPLLDISSIENIIYHGGGRWAVFTEVISSLLDGNDKNITGVNAYGHVIDNFPSIDLSGNLVSDKKNHTILYSDGFDHIIYYNEDSLEQFFVSDRYKAMFISSTGYLYATSFEGNISFINTFLLIEPPPPVPVPQPEPQPSSVIPTVPVPQQDNPNPIPIPIPNGPKPPDPPPKGPQPNGPAPSISPQPDTPQPATNNCSGSIISDSGDISNQFRCIDNQLVLNDNFTVTNTSITVSGDVKVENFTVNAGNVIFSNTTLETDNIVLNNAVVSVNHTSIHSQSAILQSSIIMIQETSTINITQLVTENITFSLQLSTQTVQTLTSQGSYDITLINFQNHTGDPVSVVYGYSTPPPACTDITSNVYNSGNSFVAHFSTSVNSNCDPGTTALISGLIAGGTLLILFLGGIMVIMRRKWIKKEITQIKNKATTGSQRESSQSSTYVSYAAK